MATKPKLDTDLSGEPVDQTDYHSKIGLLMYLTSSRPDIVQAGSGFELTAFLDADHVGCVDTHKSTSGGIQFLGDKLVSKMSKNQDCIAMSSVEAKCVALSASFSHSNLMQPRAALPYQAHPYSGNCKGDGQGGQVGGQGSEVNGDQGRGEKDGRNQNGDAVNDNILGDVNRGCTYKEFLACKPKEYDGKGGAIVYTRWIEKMESIHDMSGCRDSQRVKYTTGSFVGKALTWWNSEIRTRGREAAVGMSWEDFKILTREEFCPSNEMQKLETELWNHAMVEALAMLHILIGFISWLGVLQSTSGGLQFLGEKLVSWSSKKQDCTAMYTTEAEYVSLSACCAQVISMRTQMLDYRYKYNRIPMYCDSKSAITISCNPVQHSKTKHIDICYHFIKEHVEKGIVELYLVGTEYQLADLFTKALPKERFEYLVHHIVIIMAQQQQHAADVHPDELCPLNKRYDLMDANKKIDFEYVECLPESKILMNIIQNHPLRFSIAASSSVPWIYMAPFWHTLKDDGSKYRHTFMLDRKELSLTLDDFRTIFLFPPANANHHERFIPPPSFVDMVPFYKNELGFTMELKTTSSFKTTGLLQPWQTLCKIFSKCLTTRVTGWDQPPL
ncbi:hypothetical protein Tco_1522272 [Tanacetum coccineum]